MHELNSGKRRRTGNGNLKTVGRFGSRSAGGKIVFSELRGDWVRGADLLARLIARSRIDGLMLEGFPLQWVPLFIHFDVNWHFPSKAERYLPLISDIDEQALVELSHAAKKKGH